MRQKETLKGQTALVTGSSRGIGRAIATVLGAHGADVVIHYKERKLAADDTAAELQRMGCRTLLCQADFSRVEEILNLREQVLEELGGIDILVNNAGINQDKSLLKMDQAQWHQVITTNLAGVFHCTQAFAPSMVKRGHGRVVNISSVVGETGAFGQTNYAASKAGVIGFTKSLARELCRKGITVNSVAPGYIDTDMLKSIPENHREAILSQIPMKRFGSPQEVADAVLFLVSPEAGYITGHVLKVNGGIYM